MTRFSSEPSSAIGPVTPGLEALKMPREQGLFDGVPTAPEDPIFGISRRFQADTRPEKVNLGIGVYRGPSGKTDPLNVVLRAQAAIAERRDAPGYLPISGLPEFNRCIGNLVLGCDSNASRQGRVLVQQALGGTGALRLASEFFKQVLGVTQIAVSDPTWENHYNVFSASGLSVSTYPYFSPEKQGIDFDRTLSAIEQLPPKTAVLLHGCCHNPTGVDLVPEHWKHLVGVFQRRGLIPLLDFAYQGFGEGIHADALSARLFADSGVPMFIAQSCSKTFSLYGKRTGALIMVGEKSRDVGLASGHLQRLARGSYSNPPEDGARIVAEILSNADLSREWTSEVHLMRAHVRTMREALVGELAEHGVDMSHLSAQKGMFSYTGISPEHAEVLRRDHGIYVLDTGRLCVPALNQRNLPWVVSGIASVLTNG